MKGILACHLTSGSASKVPLLFLPRMFSVPVTIRVMLEDGTMEAPPISSGLQPTPGRCHAQKGRAEKSSGSLVWHQGRTHRVRGPCGDMSAWLDPPTGNEVVAAVALSASRLKTHRGGLARGSQVQRSSLPIKAECDCEPEWYDDSNTISLSVSFNEVDTTASAALLEPQDATTFPPDSRSQGGIPERQWTGVHRSH